MFMLDYDPVFYSRLLTFMTLAFHINFATIGVGFPILIGAAEWLGIRRQDPHYILMARRWTRAYTVTVAVGVVTGTAIGIQLSLLWPSFMRIAGQSIALPLFMETFAFFFEAIFLGIYLYTWDRFKKPLFHFLLFIPVIIGSSASAFFITVVNAFMNTPQGFSLENGVIFNIQPVAAMFNPATPTKVSHVLSSAYMTSAFILAALAAYSILKGRKHDYYKKALRLTMVAAFIFSWATAVIGDLSGKFLAAYQPAKLAAAEWHFETIKEAPLIIGGILTENQEVKYALTIPYALSILAYGRPGAEVTGLNEFPKEEHPPLYVHYFFDAMIVIGVFLLFVALLYVLAVSFKKWSEYNRLILWCIVAGLPLSLLAIEYGWIYTEVGRQPWIVYGIMKTAEGATTSEHVDKMIVVFGILYAVLSITVIKVLRNMFKNNLPEHELESRGMEINKNDL